MRERLAALNCLLYQDEGFRGNREHYDDFRNSLLHLVLERRLGIPISLAVIYITLARHAGLDVSGICFPGHFLLRASLDGEPIDPRDGVRSGRFAVLDPFDAGRELDEAACRALLARQAGEEVPYQSGLLAACPPRQIVMRMLNNLKRTYINMRSFPQAWRATELLLALDPRADADLRDRGLLSFHLQAWPDALRDLEDYLRRSKPAPDEDSQERERIWDHVTGLRRKIATMN
jgi:regulator of sirC expression with transglutaminase-like and TPR domain